MIQKVWLGFIAQMLEYAEALATDGDEYHDDSRGSRLSQVSTEGFV